MYRSVLSLLFVLSFQLAVTLSVFAQVRPSYLQIYSGQQTAKHRTSVFMPRKNEIRTHAFSGTLVLSLEAGATAGLTDYDQDKPRADYAAKGMLEYFFPSISASVFGLRAFGGGGYLAGQNPPADSRAPYEFRTKMMYYGGGLVYALSLGDAFFPYVFAGLSAMDFTPRKTSGFIIPEYRDKSRSVLTYNGEIGFRVLLARDLSFNMNAAVNLPQNDKADGLDHGVKDDIFFTAMAGLSVSFFGSRDDDHDGIYNNEDACPDEPEDYDGYRDEDGCPDADNDSDQIRDADDDCPQQAEDYDGYRDDDGCPDLDNDKDGILDVDDRCPNQAEDFDGFEDNDGCPDNDNDKDGILDSQDKCPRDAETYNGYEDEDGCPDEKPQPKVEAPKEIILSSGTNFAPGKAELLPFAYTQLEKVAQVMRDNPETRWRIEGHTDNTGSARKNKALSLQRARAVLNYFISVGLDPLRFEVYGMGQDMPAADNKTKAGQAKNRRVVILRIN